MITLKRATPEAVRYACLNYHYAKQVPNHQLSYNVYNEGGNGAVAFCSGMGVKRSADNSDSSTVNF